VKFSTGGDSKLDKSASATSVDLVKVQNRRWQSGWKRISDIKYYRIYL